MTDTFATIRRLVAWLDHANGPSDHETAMRLMKLTEETGEVMQAYIGTVGQNPRKGITHTRADVADELCDVIVTAMVALHRFTDDPEQHLTEKLQRIAARVPQTDSWVTPPAFRNACGVCTGLDGDHQIGCQPQENLC